MSICFSGWTIGEQVALYIPRPLVKGLGTRLGRRQMQVGTWEEAGGEIGLTNMH